jgi:hypothetical protein
MLLGNLSLRLIGLLQEVSIKRSCCVDILLKNVVLDGCLILRTASPFMTASAALNDCSSCRARSYSILSLVSRLRRPASI